MNISEYAETVMGFINKCIKHVTVIKPVNMLANQKPLCTAEVHKTGAQHSKDKPALGHQASKAWICRASKPSQTTGARRVCVWQRHLFSVFTQLLLCQVWGLERRASMEDHPPAYSQHEKVSRQHHPRQSSWKGQFTQMCAESLHRPVDWRHIGHFQHLTQTTYRPSVLHGHHHQTCPQEDHSLRSQWLLPSSTTPIVMTCLHCHGELVREY